MTIDQYLIRMTLQGSIGWQRLIDGYTELVGIPGEAP